jgi:flagellar motor switch protein FliG
MTDNAVLKEALRDIGELLDICSEQEKIIYGLRNRLEELEERRVVWERDKDMLTELRETWSSPCTVAALKRLNAELMQLLKEERKTAKCT